MDLSQLVNSIAFNDFISFLNKNIHNFYYTTEGKSYNLDELTKEIKTLKVNDAVIDERIKYMNSIIYLISHNYDEISTQYKFEVGGKFDEVMKKFLFEYRQYIDYNLIRRRTIECNFLEKFLFTSKNRLIYPDIFVNSLRYIDYNEQFLGSMVENDSINLNGYENEFILNMLKFQFLSENFILRLWFLLKKKKLNNEYYCYNLVTKQPNFFNIQSPKIMKEIRDKADLYIKSMEN